MTSSTSHVELRPGAYAVLRPRPRLVHRAGHAWEQVVLPLRSARLRAPLLLCPANLAPAVSRNAVLVLHDTAALRHPGWYSGAYAAYQRALLPLIARRARRVITVSPFSRDELGELAEAFNATARRIREYHHHITGVDDRGHRYHALDPEVFFWAHATIFDALYQSIELFDHPMSESEKERLYAESRQVYRAYGVSDRVVPPDWAGFLAYFDRMCREELVLTPAAKAKAAKRATVVLRVKKKATR